MHKQPDIPNAEKFNQYLGDHCRLNGSFASLWPIESLLRVLRKKPSWQHHVPWLPEYIASIVERASKDLDLGINLDPNHFLAELLNPSAPLQLWHGGVWSNTPYLQLGAAPFLVLNQLMSPSSPSRNDAVTHWLIEDYIVSEFREHDEEILPTARKILKAMLQPSITEPNNTFAEYNLPQLQHIFSTQPFIDYFVNCLLQLLISQDRMLSLLAGATSFLIHIAPTSAAEARTLKQTISYFKFLPTALSGESPDRIIEIVQMLTSAAETPLTGGNDPRYLETLSLANRQNYEQACTTILPLIQSHPDNALYLRARGRLFEKLGKDDLALDDYNNAIAFKSDYWQAYVHRANFLARRKQFTQAILDYTKAIEIRPDHENTRENLLTVYFLNLENSEF